MKSDIKLLLCAVPLAVLSYSAYAQSTGSNQASVVRTTDLKAQAFSDAATLKVLPENLKLDILSRKASWMEVKALGTVGWVKMLSLRFDNKTESSSSGFADTAKNLLNVAKTGSSGSTVTTGAKGFDKEKFSNPTPNLEALATMKMFATPKNDASDFAKQEKLTEQNQNYVKTPGGKS